MPDNSSDESHMKEEFTTQMVIRIIWEAIKYIKSEWCSRPNDPDSEDESPGIHSL